LSASSGDPNADALRVLEISDTPIRRSWRVADIRVQIGLAIAIILSGLPRGHAGEKCCQGEIVTAEA